MPDPTDAAASRTGRRVSGYCQLDAHRTCQPGPVLTSYGDVALTIRCDCTCHKAGGR